MGEQPTLPGLKLPAIEREPTRWRRRLLIGAITLAIVLVVAGVGAAGYLAWENGARADRWEGRAAELEINVESLNDVLLERSDALNERTEELNSMAAKVQVAEQTIARSEADVRSLERRQRRLANEKAQVEDARAALALEADALGTVASAFITCKSGLDEYLGYVLAGNGGAANAVAGRVSSDCGAAESELSSYLARYG